MPLLADGLAARGWKVQLCCQGHSCAQSNKTRSVEACLDNLHHQYIHCHNSPDGEVRSFSPSLRFLTPHPLALQLQAMWPKPRELEAVLTYSPSGEFDGVMCIALNIIILNWEGFVCVQDGFV